MTVVRNRVDDGPIGDTRAPVKGCCDLRLTAPGDADHIG